MLLSPFLRLYELQEVIYRSTVKNTLPQGVTFSSSFIIQRTHGRCILTHRIRNVIECKRNKRIHRHQFKLFNFYDVVTSNVTTYIFKIIYSWKKIVLIIYHQFIQLTSKAFRETTAVVFSKIQLPYRLTTPSSTHFMQLNNATH